MRLRGCLIINGLGPLIKFGLLGPLFGRAPNWLTRSAIADKSGDSVQLEIVADPKKPLFPSCACVPKENTQKCTSLFADIVSSFLPLLFHTT